MGRSRKSIVFDGDLLHVTFKCHNSQFYFHSDEMKETVIKIVARTRKEYGIPILEWILMSNHVHFKIFVPKLARFSDFMRTTNSKIAKLINKVEKKTGQAIQDRFKSPVIENETYAMNTIQYIWMNPVRAEMIPLKELQNFKYCSLFYKFRGLKDPICADDCYEQLKELNGFSLLNGRSEHAFVVETVNEIKSKEHDKLDLEIFLNSHSIGGMRFVKERKGYRPDGPEP